MDMLINTPDRWTNVIIEAGRMDAVREYSDGPSKLRLLRRKMRLA